MMKTNKSEESLWRPTNAHDRFCRSTAFHPFYAPDFLRNYGDPILAQSIDLDNLQEAPTVHLSKEMKEVLMDASLSTRLLDTKNQSEVLLHLEHKSQPSQAVAIQLLTEAALTLNFHWTSMNRPESGFVVPIPLMIIVYNGPEDWSGVMSFLDIFPDVPPSIYPYVIQFKIFVINLRRFQYGHLPGEPHTQAIVESLMRATDGTFTDHLPHIMGNVARSRLSEGGRFDLTHTISVYSTWSAGATSKQLTHAITTAFKGQEGITMAQTIEKNWIQEGIEIGKAEGEAKAILKILHKRFSRVPLDVTETLSQMADLTALDSYLDFALSCSSIEEFADSLKS